MHIEELITLIKSSNTHQIRSGSTHRFIDITIVETKNRFFVRQYKFAKPSWYDAFIKAPSGEIKCADKTIAIEGRVPKDLETINKLVTKAYWRKLHIIYGVMRLGFSTKKHEASTLELIPQL